MYSVTVDVTDHYSVAGFLDMLRYDDALVRGWLHHGDSNLWTVTFTRPHGLPVTTERWWSFGLYPRLVEG